MAVALAVAVVWGAWLGVSRSQLFEIERIDVTGNEQLAEAEVLASADVPEGATLLRIDEDAILDGLRANPWVAQADLSRRIPSTLRITVVERVPVALVDTGVSFWYVDGDGRVIVESTPDTSTVLPVVRDVPDFTAEPGVVSRSENLRNALAVLRGISTSLASSVKVITAPTKNETTLLTATGVEIMIGEAVRLEEKSLVVEDILAERGEQVVFIDVRSVERPISRGLNP